MKLIAPFVAAALLLLGGPRLVHADAVAPDDEHPLARPGEATEHAPDAPDTPRESAPLPHAPEPPLPPGRLRPHLLGHAPAGKQPTTCALSLDGATLFVANRGDNTVSVLDAKTLETRSVVREVGYGAWGLAPLADGKLLVSNWAGSGIAVIDPATGERVGEIPAGMKPSYLVVSQDGSRVFSAGNFGGEITIGDIASRKLLRSLDVGSRPMGVALTPDGKFLHVAICGAGLVARVDVAQETVVERVNAPLATTTNLVITPDGTRLLAAGTNNRLLVIDLAGGPMREVQVGRDPAAVAVTPDGRTALVANYGDSSVTLVDLTTLEAHATIAAGPGTLHVTTDGRRFWTCNDKGGTVSAFLLETAEQHAARNPPRG